MKRPLRAALIAASRRLASRWAVSLFLKFRQNDRVIWQVSITRDDITLAIAILGGALGILNFVRLWWRDRLRLKVIPKLYASIGGAVFRWPKHDEAFLKQHLTKSPRFCIEVQNRGTNPVTIATVGFLKSRETI